jgi:hypothetical protein
VTSALREQPSTKIFKARRHGYATESHCSVWICGTRAVGSIPLARLCEHRHLQPDSQLERYRRHCDHLRGAFHSATVDFDNSASWTLNLTSGSLTLDSGSPALNAFSFGDSSAGPETISVSGLTLGTLSLANMLVQSDANPDAPLSGSNPYALSTSNVMDSASYVVTPTGGSAKSGGLSNRGTPMTGTIVTGGTPPVLFGQAEGMTGLPLTSA